MHSCGVTTNHDRSGINSRQSVLTILEVKMTKADRTAELLLSQCFTWSRADPQTYELRWDIQSLAKLHADRIRLLALPVDSSGSLLSYFGDFSSGAITIEIPDPDKPYIAHFEALRYNARVLYCIETLGAPPKR